MSKYDEHSDCSPVDDEFSSIASHTSMELHPTLSDYKGVLPFQNESIRNKRDQVSTQKDQDTLTDNFAFETSQ